MSQFSPLHITFAVCIPDMVGMGCTAWHCTRSVGDRAKVLRIFPVQGELRRSGA